MSSLYAMRRANGDWFAFDDGGRLQVPVFRSSREAALARMSNAGMMLFAPAALDAHALTDIAPAADDDAVYFWLVDDPAANVRRGSLIEHARLAQLVRDGGGATPATAGG